MSQASKVCSDLDAVVLDWLSRNYDTTGLASRVVGVLRREIEAGNECALRIGEMAMQQTADLWHPTWEQALAGKCLGITNKGERCSSVSDTASDGSYLFLCKRHIHQMPALWSEVFMILQESRRLLSSRATWSEVIASAEDQEQVYFISDGHYLKIGRSVDPYKRLQSLKSRSGSKGTITPAALDKAALRLLTTVVGGARRERELHRSCWQWRIEGEWFRLTRELHQHLRALGIDLGGVS